MSDQQRQQTHVNTIGLNHVSEVSEHEEEAELQVEIEEDELDQLDVVSGEAKLDDSNELAGTLHGVGQDEVSRSLMVVNGGELRLKETRTTMGTRTVILPAQKQILENFFNTGMISASNKLRHLHEAAADQTGLDLHVIKNWVRNRRRPLVSQKKQDLNQMIAVNSLPGSTSPQTPATPHMSSSSPSTVAVTTLAMSLGTPNHYIPAVTTQLDPTIVSCHQLIPPEPKRPCIEQRKINSNISSMATTSSLIVKVRIADSDETDFVEVEVEKSSYVSLLKNSCEELGVSASDVVKIRKLPNVLVRKDKDVARMTEGQEIEVVLRSPLFLVNSSSSVSVPPSLINFTGQDATGSVTEYMN